jgi:hypothetical protein
LWTKIGTKQPCWGWDWDWGWEWGAKCGEERQSMAGGCSAWRRGDQGSCSCTTCVCRRARDQTYSVASCNSCQTTTAIAGAFLFFFPTCSSFECLPLRRKLFRDEMTVLQWIQTCAPKPTLWIRRQHCSKWSALVNNIRTVAGAGSLSLWLDGPARLASWRRE